MEGFFVTSLFKSLSVYGEVFLWAPETFFLGWVAPRGRMAAANFSCNMVLLVTSKSYATRLKDNPCSNRMSARHFSSIVSFASPIVINWSHVVAHQSLCKSLSSLIVDQSKTDPLPMAYCGALERVSVSRVRIRRESVNDIITRPLPQFVWREWAENVNHKSCGYISFALQWATFLLRPLYKVLYRPNGEEELNLVLYFCLDCPALSSKISSISVPRFLD